MGLEEVLNSYRPENDPHVRPEVRERWASGLPIAAWEWDTFRGNSYERELLVPLLDDEALCHEAEQCLKNGYSHARRPCATYTEALAHIYAPLLIQRLKEKLR